jgi:signal transduction histidine kinase
MHESGRKGTGRLALDAAHAATLSQRLARLYLMQRWGVKQETSGREIPAVAADLQRTLEKLRAAPQNTPEIVTELQAAEGQMGFLLQGGARAGRQARQRALARVHREVGRPPARLDGAVGAPLRGKLTTASAAPD